MNDKYSSPDEVVTAGMLLNLLSGIPANTKIRIYSHHVYDGLDAYVFEKLKRKHVGVIEDPTGDRALAIIPSSLVDDIDSGKNVKIITKEQEDAASFKLKSLQQDENSLLA